MKYVCDVCGWEYDEEEGYPEGGIAPGTKWEDLSLIHIQMCIRDRCRNDVHLYDTGAGKPLVLRSG